MGYIIFSKFYKINSNNFKDIINNVNALDLCPQDKLVDHILLGNKELQL